MTNLKKTILFIAVFCVLNNIAFSSELFCIDNEYSGDFNIRQKPDPTRCESLKGYDLSYDSCISFLADEISSYKRGLAAYNNGNCFKYKKAKHRYGSVSCSVQYIISKNGYSIIGSNNKSNSPDTNICIEQLESIIKQKQKALQQTK